MLKLKNDRGSAIVLVVASMVVLLGFAALSTDVGLLFLNRERLVNAADAAALAGAQFLPVNPAEASLTALDFAVKNGIQPIEATVNVESDGKVLMVRARRQVSLYFAPVLGIDSMPVAAQARARVGGVERVTGVVPLGIPEQVLEYGRIYSLKVAGGEAETGNFGCLALGGLGAGNYEERLKYGYQEWLEIGDFIDTEPGNMSGSTERAVSYRVTGHESCTYTNHCENCPRLVFVPVYRDEPLSGRDTVQIIGFAAFFLEGTTGSGNECYVNGHFVREFDGFAEGLNGPDYGLRTVKLVE